MTLVRNFNKTKKIVNVLDVYQSDTLPQQSLLAISDSTS